MEYKIKTMNVKKTKGSPTHTIVLPKTDLHPWGKKSKLGALIKDELESSKEYHKMGYHKLAEDEYQHAQFLKRERRTKYG